MAEQEPLTLASLNYRCLPNGDTVASIVTLQSESVMVLRFEALAVFTGIRSKRANKPRAPYFTTQNPKDQIPDT